MMQRQLMAVFMLFGCAFALRFVYELVRPMLWLVPVGCVIAAGVWAYRRWWWGSL